MPIFECTSKLRAADSNIILNLTAKHCLESGDSDSTTAKKSRFPNVDILPASSIVFSFSAVLNRKRIPSAVLINSQLAQHFLQFIRSNADQLGLSIVSSLYDDNSCPKISVTTNRSRLSLHDSVPVRVVLRSIHLQYSVSSKETSDGDLHLFSTRLSLPCRSLVDNILKRFVTFHLVKRYPLVFGTVCQQLDVETPFFPSIFRSILEMAKRSPNPAFRARFKQLIKSMKQQHQTAFIASSAALATYLDGSAEPDDAELPEISSETALCLSMEKLFCIGMKRPSFKTTAGLPMTQADTQDDDELSRDHFSGASTAPPTDGEDLLWKDPAGENDDYDYFDRLIPSGGLMNMDMDDPNPSQDLPTMLDSDADIVDDNDDNELLSPATDSQPLRHRHLP